MTIFGSTASLLLLSSSLWLLDFSQPVLAAEETKVSQATSQRSLLRLGSRGEEVAELQAALKLLGYYSGPVNSLYDESTVIAVSEFQRAAGIDVDGITGPGTWNRLFPAPASLTTAAKNRDVATTPKPSTTKPASKPSQPQQPQAARPTEPDSSQIDFPILRKGMRGPAVRKLQQRLRSAGFYRGPIDGVFGNSTQSAVRALQRRHRLTTDGVVGEATWNVLLR